MKSSWSTSKIGNVFKVKYGKGLVQSAREKGHIRVYGSNGIIGEHNRAFTKGPTIILGRKGSVGEVHYCPEACWPIDTTYFIDEFPEGFLPEYWTHYLRSLRLGQQDRSSAIPGLNRDDIYDREIIIPPEDDQRLILAKLDQLLPRVESCRDRLSRIPALLKRFRQSVLSAACSGKLTEDWRASHKAKESSQHLLDRLHEKRRALGIRKKPTEPDSDFLPELPDGWTLASMDELTCLVTSGSRGWAKYYSKVGPLFIRAQNINTDKLLLDDIAHVSPPNGSEGQRTRVEHGDLLITITGANVTKSALVNVQLKEAYVSQHVALVRPVDPNISTFLHFWAISLRHGRAKLLHDAYGAGKPGLNLDNIRSMPIGLPPLEEQKEIANRVESLIAIADRLEIHYLLACEQTNRLPQSILAKAFRGEL